MIGIFKPQLSKGKRKKFLLLPFAFCLLLETRLTASAQIVPDTIVPDTTLPNNSIVTPNGDITEITGGTEAGGNLFHSFKEFSVPTGGTAFFNNAPKIENIISRVTGNSISNIDGLISANGTANLFLLNPNGIIFGPNASLNIGGSFIGSTAESIKLANGSEFSATDRQALPLLKISVPIGLQYGSNAGEINVLGPGNNLSLDPNTFAVIRDNRPVGLQVQPSQTLALVGGNVALQGGNLTAEGGRIELGSVNGAGMVRLTPTNPGWTLSYEDVGNFQDISLSQAASIDTSGNGGGNIQVQGRRVTLTDGSAILADTLGNSPGGILTLRASEAVEVVGTEANNPFVSGLFTDVAEGATGNGGNLTIETGRLLVADGAQISSGTFSSGNAGTLSVTATDVELTGGSPFGPSGLFAPVAQFARGNGGHLTIETGRLRVADGAQIFANTFGFGDAGALTVRATDVELIGTSSGGSTSALLANVEEGAIGTGGNLTIETGRLLVADGANVEASTFGSGNAGTLTVRATDVELIGGSPESGSSGLFATVEEGAISTGGNLTVETGRLLVADGAQVAATTFSSGNAGTLTVRANDVELIGTSPGGTPSGLFANVEQGATGNGGNLTIETERLRVADGAQVIASTLNAGNAGTLTVRATEVELIGEAANGPSGLLTTVEPGAMGNGGNLEIETGRLRVADGAQIAVSTAGSGNAGELIVRASESVELIGISPRGRSGLFANAIFGTGNGGDLTIATDQLIIRDGATINASNFSSRNPNIPPGQGAAGNIQIEARSILLDNTLPDSQSSITASTASSGGGNIVLQVQDSLIARNGSQISTNSTGLSQAGNITILADQIETNRGEITATSNQTGGGDINFTTNLLFLSNQSLISTSVLDSTGGGGNITIDTDFIVAQENSDIQANAVKGPGGNIQISTQDIFLSPDSNITASSEFNIDGTVQITYPELQRNITGVELPENVTDPTGLIATGCPADEGNVFVVTGRGGVPEDPRQTLRGETLWSDLRPLSRSRHIEAQALRPKQGNTDARKNLIMPNSLVEAQGWEIGPDGNVILTASATNVTPKQRWQKTTACEDF